MDDFERTIRQFLAHIDVERGLSKATVSAYGADLKKYRQWLGRPRRWRYRGRDDTGCGTLYRLP